MSKLLIFIVRLYQWTLSPYIGNACRFDPTCSHYTIEAITKYGATRGSFLGAKRIMRCHPWCEGGHDPVP